MGSPARGAKDRPGTVASADKRYLRAIPVDPITDTVESWVVAPHPDGVTPGVYDVHSGATGVGRDGSPISSW